jgi:hypothetical protein
MFAFSAAPLLRTGKVSLLIAAKPSFRPCACNLSANLFRDRSVWRRSGHQRTQNARLVSVNASLDPVNEKDTTAEASLPPKPSKPPGVTRGQVIVGTLVGCVFPFVLFRALERLPGQDAVSAGRWTVAGITVLTVGWVATYLTRVGTKRTTYAQQLRAYEDAVLRRRLAELSDEELQVLLADGDDGESTGPERSFESGAASSSLSKSPEEPDRRK